MVIFQSKLKGCRSSWILPQNLIDLELSDGEMRPPEAPETMSILYLDRLVAISSDAGSIGIMGMWTTLRKSNSGTAFNASPASWKE